MHTTLWALAVTFVLSAPLLGCGAGHRAASEPEDASLTVQTAVATRAERHQQRLVTGTLRGRNTAVVAARIVAAVERFAVEPGDRVEAGQLLAVLDDTVPRAAVRRARARVHEALAAAGEASSASAAADASLTLREATRERTARLYESSTVSRQQVDEATAAQRTAAARLAMSEARIARARSGVEEARAQLAEAQAVLAFTRIEAPFAGVVIERPRPVGELVQPGTPLLTLEQDGGLRAELAVPASLAARVALGDRVPLSVDAAEVELAGVVDELVPAVDVGSRAFVAKVVLADAPETLRPGMFVRGAVSLGTRSALEIPHAAVTPLGPVDRVFVVEEGRARLRVVTLGAVVGDLVEVRAGIDAGETVVVRPPARLTDRTAVEVAR